MSWRIAKGQQVIEFCSKPRQAEGEWASDSLFAGHGRSVTSITNSCSAQAGITRC
jgi:hypothetical protein